MSCSMSDEAILWRRLDRPGHEYARLLKQSNHNVLIGVAVFQHERQPCQFQYRIVCDEQWRTESAHVNGWLGEKAIDVGVVHHSGAWLINGSPSPQLAGCADVDLNFSPSTNLLPIRRLNLAVGSEALVEAAWLRFPGFTLERLEQSYQRLSDLVYRYESGGGNFVAELEVNTEGFVTLYPGFCIAE
jgi:uncharacterized protein